MGDEEELDYISSSPLLATPPEVQPQDERDLPTLKKIQKQLGDTIDAYSNIAALDLTEVDFPIKQQLAINHEVAHRLSLIKQTVDNTVADVKEKYSDEQ